MAPKQRSATVKVVLKAQRSALGSLDERRVGERAHKRYKKAVVAFIWWCWWTQLPLALDYETLDNQAAFYLEHLYSEGESRNAAGDTLSGIQFFLRRKRILSGAWEIYKSWLKAEGPYQVPPMPALVLQALFGVAWASGDVGFVAVCALAFHCMLRTTEFLSACGTSVSLDSSNKGLVNLGKSKSGKRKGHNEFVAIEDPLVGFLVKLALAGSVSGRVFDGCPATFRARLDSYLASLGVSSLQFKPYSFRRGGATFDFQRFNSLDRTILRGRWESLRVARIYINEGLLAMTSFQLGPALNANLLEAAALFKP